MSKRVLQSEKTTDKLFYELNNLVNRYDLPNDLEVLLLEMLDRYLDGKLVGTDDFRLAFENEPPQILPNESVSFQNKSEQEMDRIGNYLMGYSQGAEKICEGIESFVYKMIQNKES